jgi:hypothetical protein
MVVWILIVFNIGIVDNIDSRDECLRLRTVVMSNPAGSAEAACYQVTKRIKL